MPLLPRDAIQWTWSSLNTARALSGLCGVSIFYSVFVNSSPLGLCIIHCLIPSLILPLSSKDMASLPVMVPDVISSSPKTVDPHATSFFFTLDLFSALSPIAGTASSASSGRQVSIFNPLLLYSTQRICMGRQCVSNCSLSLQLHALLFPPSGLPGSFTLWRPNPRSWPSHLLLHRLHRNSCPQPVSDPLTTKPVLHLLSLSDFDTLSHAILWGEGVLSRFMQTCVTYLYLARTSLKCLSPYCCTLCITDEPHFQGLVFTSCHFSLSIKELPPDSNDDSLQDLPVRFPDKSAFLKCMPCVPCCSYPLLGPLTHGASVL